MWNKIVGLTFTCMITSVNNPMYPAQKSPPPLACAQDWFSSMPSPLPRADTDSHTAHLISDTDAPAIYTVVHFRVLDFRATFTSTAYMGMGATPGEQAWGEGCALGQDACIWNDIRRKSVVDYFVFLGFYCILYVFGVLVVQPRFIIVFFFLCLETPWRNVFRRGIHNIQTDTQPICVMSILILMRFPFLQGEKLN